MTEAGFTGGVYDPRISHGQKNKKEHFIADRIKKGNLAEGSNGNRSHPDFRSRKKFCMKII